MDPINNVSQLVEILRRRLTESDRKTGTAATASPRNTAAGSANARLGTEELQRKVREKIRQIDANDPKALQKSIQLFLESVLVSEFGEQLMEDPKFYSLLDEIRISMESDPAIKDQLSQMIAGMR